MNWLHQISIPLLLLWHMKWYFIIQSHSSEHFSMPLLLTTFIPLNDYWILIFQRGNYSMLLEVIFMSYLPSQDFLLVDILRLFLLFFQAQVYSYMLRQGNLSYYTSDSESEQVLQCTPEWMQLEILKQFFDYMWLYINTLLFYLLSSYLNKLNTY